MKIQLNTNVDSDADNEGQIKCSKVSRKRSGAGVR